VKILIAIVAFALLMLGNSVYIEIKNEHRFPWITLRVALAFAILCIFGYWIASDLFAF
jgi:hypothetical protein